MLVTQESKGGCVVTVFVCGKASDDSIRQVLPGALAAYGDVQYFNGEEWISLPWKNSFHRQFFVCEWESLPRYQGPAGLLLLKNSFCPGPKDRLSPGLLPVFESHNQKALAFLHREGASAITCGMSPRDTLSLASVDYHSATVSIQRCIPLLDGTVLEPGDIPVELGKPYSPHQILAAVSVLLFCGVPSKEGYQL